MDAERDAEWWRNRVFMLAGLVVLGYGVWLLAPVLAPFLFAAVLAYLGDPLADRLEALGLSRTLSVVTVFTGMFVLIVVLLVFIVPMLERQASDLYAQAPAAVDWYNVDVRGWLRQQFNVALPALRYEALKKEVVTALQSAGSDGHALIATISQSSAAIVGWAVTLLLVPVVTFYLLRDWDLLVADVRGLLPRSIEPKVTALARESDAVLGAFLRGQFAVMLALAIVYGGGLTLVGLDYGLLIGLIAGLVSFVPYFGFFSGIVLAGLAALVQFHAALPLLAVFGVFAFGQLLESFVLTPRFVGGNIGLHPVAVIFALMAGEHLFGFFGILLALPVASVIMVMLRHTHDSYVNSEMYETPPPPDLDTDDAVEPGITRAAVRAHDAPEAPDAACDAPAQDATGDGAAGTGAPDGSVISVERVETVETRTTVVTGSAAAGAGAPAPERPA